MRREVPEPETRRELVVAALFLLPLLLVLLPVLAALAWPAAP